MHIFHCFAAPELVNMAGLRDNNLLSRRLRGVVSIRFPYQLRVGEQITAIVQLNDLNVAATVRQREICTKTLVSILPGTIGQPTGGVEEAVAIFTQQLGGCSEAKNVVRSCFQKQELGDSIAFEPGAIHFVPETNKKGGETMNETKINVVQFVVHNAGTILASGIEAVGPNVTDQRYRVRKAVEHGEDTDIWYQVLFTVEPATEDPLAKVVELLKSA